MAAHAAEVQQLQSDASLARKAADDAIQDAAEANTRAATAQAAASDAADAARAREQELVRELDACRGRCDELAADASSRAKSHDQLDTELREARAEVSSLRGVVQQLQEQVRRCIPAQPALPDVTSCGAGTLLPVRRLQHKKRRRPLPNTASCKRSLRSGRTLYVAWCVENGWVVLIFRTCVGFGMGQESKLAVAVSGQRAAGDAYRQLQASYDKLQADLRAAYVHAPPPTTRPLPPNHRAWCGVVHATGIPRPGTAATGCQRQRSAPWQRSGKCGSCRRSSPRPRSWTSSCRQLRGAWST